VAGTDLVRHFEEAKSVIVRWLSRGRVLIRVFELRKEIEQFLRH